MDKFILQTSNEENSGIRPRTSWKDVAIYPSLRKAKQDLLLFSNMHMFQGYVWRIVEVKE